MPFNFTKEFDVLEEAALKATNLTKDNNVATDLNIRVKKYASQKTL